MENNNELIELSMTKKIIRAKNVMLDGSYFDDVSAKNIKIVNANLSDLEIEGAQLGGAFIYNVGMPPKGHPFYDVNAKQRPLKFEDCELSGSTIINCNLAGVSINDCNLTGMKINGIPVDDLLKAYKN
jgi:uncharacterized protein YjbI with pentapeptide repeats